VTEGNVKSVSRLNITDGVLIGIVSSLKYHRSIITILGHQGLIASLPGLLDPIVLILDSLMPEADPFICHMAQGKSGLPKG
jgi:hypothetical protein